MERAAPSSKETSIRTTGYLVGLCAVAFVVLSAYDFFRPQVKTYSGTVANVQEVPGHNEWTYVGRRPMAIPVPDAYRVTVRPDVGNENIWMIDQQQFRNLRVGGRVMVRYKTGRFVVGTSEISVKPLLR